MKIQIQDKTINGAVPVHFYNEKTIKRQLNLIQGEIEKINADLRRIINEQN